MTIRTASVRAVALGASIALAGGLLAATAEAEPRDEPAAAPAPAPKQGHSEIIVRDLTESEAASERRTGVSVEEYWTPERMASAKPSVQRASAADVRRLSRIPDSERVAPGGVKPTAGQPAATRSAERKTYSRRVGKMFYKFKKQNWVCSGAVVSSKKKDLVFTAAHCLWDKKKGYAHKIVFVPGYKKKGKNVPFGKYRAKKLAINPKFKRWKGLKEDPRHDYGAIRVKKRGKKIQKRVGSYGLQWGAKFRRKFKATGYPSFHTSGKVQKSCKGRSRLWKKYSRPKRGFGILKMKCKAVTAGSSGGPWLHRKNVNGVNSIVNSFKNPRWVGTPWFGRGVKKLYRRIT